VTNADLRPPDTLLAHGALMNEGQFFVLTVTIIGCTTWLGFVVSSAANGIVAALKREPVDSHGYFVPNEKTLHDARRGATTTRKPN
jgi:hypothetical protein